MFVFEQYAPYRENSIYHKYMVYDVYIDYLIYFVTHVENMTL